MGWRWRVTGALCGLVAGAGVLLLQAGRTAAGPEDYGIPVTQGEVSGYVADAVCAGCHGAIAESLKGLGMGRSFSRPSAANAIEDFDAAPYYHAPSDRYYAMSLNDGAYQFTRWRLAPDGTRMDVLEQAVDWIVGSGNHARVYLYRTAVGALYQLPLAWYAQGGYWAMAPGFEDAHHMGVTRLVRHRCIACHTGYPELPEGAAVDGMPEVFPEDLPEGIGCQRCHGPGAAHAGLALDREVLGIVTAAEVRAAIVNPASLPPDRARDVCYSCHLQPSVALPATLRPGRGAYDFRPGERLSDHMVQIDIADATRAPEERFEINHHPYRLEQSTCFLQSGGAFGCTTCHDPHAKAPREERAASYRAVCLSCHEAPDGIPVMAAGTHPDIAADADCTTCHMPARRPQDVTEVWMTDHRIQRGDAPVIPPPPLAKVPALVTEVTLYRPPADLEDWERTLAQALSILSYSEKTADYAADAVGRVLAAHPPDLPEPWIVFAETALTLGVHDLAFRAAQQARILAPDNPTPVKLMGLAKLKMGDTETARLLTEASLEMSAAMSEQHMNLALIHATIGDTEAALDEAHKGLAKSRTLWSAWRLIGDIEVARGNLEAAAEAFAAALAIEPDAALVRPALIAVLTDLGRMDEAARHRALLEQRKVDPE